MSIIDRNLDARQARRMSAEARYHDRMTAREDNAATMIGELIRDGRTVHYIYPAGGRYREGAQLDLIAFLIRNKYA